MLAEYLPAHLPAKLAKRFSPSEIAQWHLAIDRIYARMRSASRVGGYDLECSELTLHVLPEVYAPCFFTDSRWYAEQLPTIVGSRSLLEVGAGTGIISIACANAGAEVLAVDVNPSAVENIRLNAARYPSRVSARLSDVYDGLQADERFDVIFWAHPFNNWPEPVADMLLRSGRDHEYRSLAAYVTGAASHLTDSGALLLGTGDSADLDKIATIAIENGYALRMVAEAEMPLDEAGGIERVRYLILEFVQPQL